MVVIVLDRWTIDNLSFPVEVGEDVGEDAGEANEDDDEFDEFKSLSCFLREMESFCFLFGGIMVLLAAGIGKFGRNKL